MPRPVICDSEDGDSAAREAVAAAERGPTAVWVGAVGTDEYREFEAEITARSQP